MSDLVNRIKAATAKASAVKSGTPKRKPPVYKGATPGKVFGRVPWATEGPIGEKAERISILKAAALLADLIPASECKGMLDLSDRLRDTFGNHGVLGHMPRHKSLLYPVSAEFIPVTTTQAGQAAQDIPGAREIRKECQARIDESASGYDPEEAAYYAKRAGGKLQSTKALLSTLNDSSGGVLVPPPVLGDLIDLQRNLEVFSQAGASNITLPPNGRLTFPKLTAGSTAYWVGESNSITESQETTGSLNLQAKKLAVRVPLTNELIQFSNPSVEGVVRMDMAIQGALAADLAMLTGTGGNVIKGLTTYPTATSWAQNTDKLLLYTVSGPNGLFQPQDVENMEALLPDKVEATAWVMRKQMWAAVANRRADAVATADQRGLFMFEPMRSLNNGNQPMFNNHTLVKSSQISNTRGSGAQTYILTGDFREWMVGRIGVFEFFTDPYTKLQNYETVIQAVQFIDAGPRHAASFVMADSVTIG